MAHKAKSKLLVVNSFNENLFLQIRRDASSVSGLSSFLKKSVPAVSYTLDGDTLLQVDGETRESVCEVRPRHASFLLSEAGMLNSSLFQVLFEQDNDRTSVATMVLDALLTCPIDTR